MLRIVFSPIKYKKTSLFGEVVRYILWAILLLPLLDRLCKEDVHNNRKELHTHISNYFMLICLICQH